MNQNLTWIKLYRKLLDWGWYKDNATRSVFIHLLLVASPEDKEWNGIKVKKGQAIIGRIELSKTLGLSEQSIRTAITHLKSTSEITSRTYNHFTLITINNYSRYQQSTSKSTSNQPATNQQLTTSKEYKNIRNKELYSEIKSLTPEVIKEISIKYQVNTSFVEKQKQQLELYCESKGAKYKNYKATLMAWVLRKLDEAPKTARLKDLEPHQIEDLRLHPEKLSIYTKAGYDTSRINGKN